MDLVGFAYGEDLEDGSGRSLGYRLLAPPAQASWSAEVEALARWLQAAPYPDHWPATDLFCSVLLPDGRRVVALARYGLVDHTAAQRRGGLELVGVVAQESLDAPTAQSVYRWLLQARAGQDDLHRLGGTHRLSDVLAEAPPAGSAARPDTLAGPVPVLPVRIWQDGAFLFAAAAPGDPDHHLRLLELGAGASWQWLPLVGPDFPLGVYAQRGPLVAWTPHLAGVALKLERKTAEAAAAPAPPRRRSRLGLALVGFLVLLIVGLLGGNLWYLVQIQQHLDGLPGQLQASAPMASSQPEPHKSSRPAPQEDTREKFAAALHRLLVEKGGEREWSEERPALLERYDELVARDPDLRLRPGNDRGKVAVAALSVLAGRSADRVEESVRRALAGKGFSDKLVRLACEQVQEQFAQEVKEKP